MGIEIGKTYGVLTVVREFIEDGKSKNEKRYVCQCECGKEKVSYKSNILRITAKCTHGPRVSNEPLYKTWQKMIERCRNKNHTHYAKYGGRGIMVCDRWLESFWNFKSDMGDRLEGYTLDRIDNNKGYSPENCKWSTPAEQNRNKSETIRIEINGRTQCLTDWCKETGVDRFVAYRRVKDGWDLEKAVTTPGTRAKKRVNPPIFVAVDSICREIGDWAEDLGMSRNSVWMRLQSGWPDYYAVTLPKGSKWKKEQALAYT